ncbi:hypothetical protein ACFXAZ_25405 [Streptomyces sp. NPDC059477]|uniref:hypothetical protein n=1 Tax=Streptomyces sp. NPDC059477 TaxID=3346847 RepID=UPI0036A6C645
MPAYEALPRFTAGLDRLTLEQRRRFRQAVTAFVGDLPTGRRFRDGLRVSQACPVRYRDLRAHLVHGLRARRTRDLGVRA